MRCILPDLLVAVIKNQPDLFGWKTIYLKAELVSFLPEYHDTGANEQN